MRAATLFSGIGAPEVAMPDWTWLWHAEIEKFPSAVMAARHPASVNLGDVTADDFIARALAIGRPDIVIFGSPCQSFSVAGRRLGLDDPRGNLALVALGIVAALKPTWFVFENVPGLLSSADGRDFGLFLRAVDELGYHLAWTVLDAQFAGVAQRRERLFAVGHARDWRYPAAVLFEPEGVCGHPPTRGEAREDVTGTLTGGASAGGHGRFSSADNAGRGFLRVSPTLRAGANRTGGDRPPGTDVDTVDTLQVVSNSGERARALTTSNQRIDYETETFVAHTLKGEGFDGGEDGTGRGVPLVTHALDSFSAGRATEDGTGRGVPIVASTLKSNGDGGGLGSDPSETFVPVAFTVKDYGADAGELAPTLRSGGHDHSHANGGVMPAIAFGWQNSPSQGASASEHLTPTLDKSKTPAVSVALRGREGGGTAELGGEVATALRSSQGGGDKPHALIAAGVRRLTPRECERLQGFPDDYTLIDYRGKSAADGPRYKAIGNSMAVPVVRWILSRIDWLDKHLAMERTA